MALTSSQVATELGGGAWTPEKLRFYYLNVTNLRVNTAGTLSAHKTGFPSGTPGGLVPRPQLRPSGAKSKKPVQGTQ